MNGVLAAENHTAQFLMVEYLSILSGEPTPPTLL